MEYIIVLIPFHVERKKPTCSSLLIAEVKTIFQQPGGKRNVQRRWSDSAQALAPAAPALPLSGVHLFQSFHFAKEENASEAAEISGVVAGSSPWQVTPLS